MLKIFFSSSDFGRRSRRVVFAAPMASLPPNLMVYFFGPDPPGRCPKPTRIKKQVGRFREFTGIVLDPTLFAFG